MLFPFLASDLPHLGWGHTLLRLVVAGVLGSAIGFERELRDREAGLRTHILVAVGAALFTIVSAFGFRDVLAESGPGVLVRLDPSRIAAQIVSGIGFLGAGAIIRQGLSVRGLTTAASLWLVAAIGMASGAGFYSGAVLATAAALLALGPLRTIGFRVIERIRPDEGRLQVELPEGGNLAALLGELGDVRNLEVDDELDRRVVTVDLQHVDEQLVGRISDLEYVKAVRWRR